MRPWIDVAILSKTKNLDGSFVAYSAAGLPFLLEEGMEVAFVPPQTDMPRRAVVTSVVATGDTSAIVEFDEVCDLAMAKALVGCHCLVERKLIDEELFAEEPRTWAGWSVVDEKFGYLGEVSEVVDNPGQVLIEVQRKSADADSGTTVLIPAVDEFVLSVDVESSTIHVDIPQGLLEL